MTGSWPEVGTSDGDTSGSCLLASLSLVEGPYRATVGSGRTGWEERALFGVLLIHANQVVSADRLQEEVWGDRQPSGGVKTLRCHISKLRDALETDRDRGDEGVIAPQPAGICCGSNGARMMPIVLRSLPPRVPSR